MRGQIFVLLSRTGDFQLFLTLSELGGFIQFSTKKRVFAKNDRLITLCTEAEVDLTGGSHSYFKFISTIRATLEKSK